MLSLGRKFGESIIVTCCGHRMRIELQPGAKSINDANLVFEAGREFTIHRAEVQERVDSEGPKR